MNFLTYKSFPLLTSNLIFTSLLLKFIKRIKNTSELWLGFTWIKIKFIIWNLSKLQEYKQMPSFITTFSCMNKNSTIIFHFYSREREKSSAKIKVTLIDCKYTVIVWTRTLSMQFF